MIITHEFRIKNISKDLEDIKFKYDREITRNLSVPGFVGLAIGNIKLKYGKD